MKIFKPNHFAKINSQDYLLVITPSEEVITSICAFKNNAKEMIGCFHSYNSKTHISVNFYIDERALFIEEKLTCYDQQLQQKQPATLKICGFDYFEHQNTYTIYAKVTLNMEAETAFTASENLVESGVPGVPHITIAKSLSSKNFETLWAYFKNLPFECFFYADKIVVLKTPIRRFCEVQPEMKLKNAV